MKMMMRLPLCLVVITTMTGLSSGFMNPSPVSSSSRPMLATTTTTNQKKKDNNVMAMKMITDPAMVQEIASARFAFWMCFYGAGGVGSIGRELIPIVFGRYQSTNALGSSSATATMTTTSKNSNVVNDDLGIWGYPDKISKSDVESILRNSKSAAVIAKKFPIEEMEGSADRYEYTHIPKPSFLSYEAFVLYNPRANPVAVRAVFDSFSNSIGGGNAVSTIVAQQRIDLYREDVTRMVEKLNSGKSLGIAAFFLGSCVAWCCRLFGDLSHMERLVSRMARI